MLRIVASLAAVAVLQASGCSSEPQMVTRTYELRQGDASWQAVTMVLDQEWRQHDVISNAERRDGSVAVKTTPRAHREIEAALAAE